MLVKYTRYGRTKIVRATPLNMRSDEKPEGFLFIENEDDEYALDSPKLKGRKVAVIRKEDWDFGQEVKK